MLWNMPNPFSCNESQKQAKKWVDKSIIKCPHSNCSRNYAVGGTFRFNSDLLSTLYYYYLYTLPLTIALSPTNYEPSPIGGAMEAHVLSKDHRYMVVNRGRNKVLVWGVVSEERSMVVTG